MVRASPIGGTLLAWVHALALLLALPTRCAISLYQNPVGSKYDGRAVVLFEDATAEDRSTYLRSWQDDGYACWLFPASFTGSVCIQDRDTLLTIPKTAADLRKILGRVNLREWLSGIICPLGGAGLSPARGGTETEAGRSISDCHEEVENALMESSPGVQATVALPDAVLSVGATAEDVPWLEAIDACLEPTWASRMQPHECRGLYTVLAAARGEKQLLPALRLLAAHPTTWTTTPTSTSFGRESESPVESVEKLIALLDPSEAGEDGSSLRIQLPVPGGRNGGSALAFKAEVNLGASLRARLAAGKDEPAEGTLGPAWESNHGPSAGASGRDSSRAEASALAPLERCETLLVVDGVIALRIPITSLEATQTVYSAVVPVYDNSVSCSAHPAAAEVAAAAGKIWPTASEDNSWHIEAREVDRVCTNNVYGSHVMHAELACYGRGRAASASTEFEPALGSSDLKPSQPLSPPEFEVVATAAPVEYFHTANGEESVSGSSKAGQREGEEQESIFASPPEELTVSLYLENAHDPVNVVVAVPRWSSDGEVWEAASEVCSNAFGLANATLVNMNDCVDLAIRTIRDKRVDLYNRMVLRLTEYLLSVNPSFTVEGHTGLSPEKVEALGAIPREGGELVHTVCEVGFNAGHSSLNWLLNSHPSTGVLVFDLGEHDYVEHALRFLQAVFPGRLELKIGDSGATVPAYAEEEERGGRDPRVCGVLFVDGDHSEDATYADLVNFQAMARRSWHAFVIDDLDMPSVSAGLKRFREEGRGRLERVVQATMQHNILMVDDEEFKGTKWNVFHANEAHRMFLKHGYYVLGIGSFRLPSSHLARTGVPNQV